MFPQQCFRNNVSSFAGAISSARTSTSVISAGKCETRRHSTTNFSENIAVAQTSYRKVRSFIILRSGKGLTSFNKNNRANFSGEKKK